MSWKENHLFEILLTADKWMHSKITNHSKIMRNGESYLTGDLTVKIWPYAISSTKDTNGPSAAPRTPSPCRSNNVRKAFCREDSPAVPQLVPSILVPQYLEMEAKAPTWLCAFNCKSLPIQADLTLLAYYHLLWVGEYFIKLYVQVILDRRNKEAFITWVK
jgi:hypothetical protein